MHNHAPTRAQSLTMLISGVAFVCLLVAMIFTTAPYAVQSPGPTINTLGDYRDIELISISGTDTYPDSDGELRLTTVVASGGPGYPVTVPDAIRGWFTPTSTVLPVEALYPPEVTREEMDSTAQQQMSRSQHDATVLALDRLGIEVPATIEVAGTDPHSQAHGVVQEEDVVVGLSAPEVGEVEFTVYSDLAEALAEIPPETDVTLNLRRDGEPTQVTLQTSDDGYGGSLLGLFLTPDFDMPFDVDIEVDKVGGPSAGTMFTLGIMDLLSPEPLVGDHIVAGTGTISLNGLVGPIGGIRQKLHGAQRDGAEYFLAPGENCDQVVGHVPDGLTVVKVDTLDDAIDAAHAIQTGDVADLPSCQPA